MRAAAGRLPGMHGTESDPVALWRICVLTILSSLSTELALFLAQTSTVDGYGNRDEFA